MTIRFMICRIGVPAPNVEKLHVCGAHGGTGLNRTQLGTKFGV